MKTKTVLITGASRGIGRSIALKFASAHYNVIINAKTSLKELLALSDEIQQMGSRCLPILADVSNHQAVEEMFMEISLEFPHIDLVINNAGISHLGLLTDTGPEKWHEVISTNLSSVYHVCFFAVPQMIKKQSGRIINISSIWGSQGASMEVAYSASKGGVNSFTKALAKELGPSGIQVNAIACGAIETNMNNWLSTQEKSNLEDQIALCRFGKPEEVAELVFFLASESSSYITGQIIHLDGCML